MPQPLVYMQLDASGEFQLENARKTLGKKGKPADIKHLKYFADPRGDIKAANLAVWEKVIRDFAYNVQNFRSVLLDTATELLDVRKIAEWGRNMQIMQMYYGSMYADFRWMVKEARNHDANVWFVHRAKDEYINDAKTGGEILDGWRGIMFESQVHVTHDRTDEGVFTTTIEECEQNALAMGAQLDSEEGDNNFVGLAMRVFPGSEESDWK